MGNFFNSESIPATINETFYPEDSDSCVYVLLLGENKRYVGWTNNLPVRLQEHLDGKGSAWTKKYGYIKCEQVIPTTDRFDEDKYTKKLMAEYGIENVRGGSYITIELSPDTKLLLMKELRMSTNRCLGCGRPGHYIDKCLYDKTGQLKTTQVNQRSKIVSVSENIIHSSKSIDIPPAYTQNRAFVYPNAVQSNINQPINAGKIWTGEEENLLLSRLNSGMSIAQMAILHGRSEYAIECRLEKIIKSA